MKSQKTYFFSRKFNVEIISHKRIKTIMRENRNGSSRLFRTQRPSNNKFPGFILQGHIVITSPPKLFSYFQYYRPRLRHCRVAFGIFNFLDTCRLGQAVLVRQAPTCSRRYCLSRVQTFPVWLSMRILLEIHLSICEKFNSTSWIGIEFSC